MRGIFGEAVHLQGGLKDGESAQGPVLQFVADEMAVAMKQLEGVMWGDPPLTEEDGRDILTDAASGDPTVFDGLQGHVPEKELGWSPADAEWGLGVSKGSSKEAFVVGGRPNDVDWSNYKDYVDGIAHSHPKKERPRRHNGEFFLTLADLDKLNYEPVRHLLPSPEDVRWAQSQRQNLHTVYTAYYYDGLGKIMLTAPEGRGKANIVFFIRDAKPIRDSKNPHTYRRNTNLFSCHLEMEADGDIVWQRSVVADLSHPSTFRE